MSLSRKFVLLLLISICSIAILNIAAFYVIYSINIKIYLSEKINERKDVTIEYINNIIERQTLDDIDDIFSDVEFEFFDLLDINDGTIPLGNTENVNILVDYLRKSWVSPQYIEKIIPENNLEKVLSDLQQKDSPESLFVSRIFFWMILFNILLLSSVTLIVFILAWKIIRPIKKATIDISKLRPGKDSWNIEYKHKDEVGLLINSINELSSKLTVQEKIRSRLLADISHELKTPITSIQCYLEWISDGVIELSDKNLDAIISEMTRLVDLVNRIMEYERFENSEIIIKKYSYNPYDIIYSVSETFFSVLLDCYQSVDIIWSKNIELYLDKDLFTQLVYNVIWNFHKYAWSNALLTIFISSEKIMFSDNWKWIQKKEVEFLFDKFYQGKKEKTWNIQERWIWVGLSIVKKIVELHDWNVKIESDIDKWFSFEVYFK